MLDLAPSGFVSNIPDQESSLAGVFVEFDRSRRWRAILRGSEFIDICESDSQRYNFFKFALFHSLQKLLDTHLL